VPSPYTTILRLTPKTIRRRFYATVLLVGVVGLLEAFSLSTLFALFRMDFNDDGNGYLAALRDWLVGVDGISAEYILISVVLFLFVFKAFIALVVSRHSYRTAIATRKYFQDQLFQRYLHSRFDEQAGKRSADWIRSITVDSNVIEGRFFMPVLVLLGEIIPAIFVCTLLLFINATAFFVAISVFTVVGIIILLATHRRLVLLGQAQQVAEGQIVESAQQAFQGVRELTIYNLQGWAQRRFESFTDASSRAANEALFINQIPRFVFEVAIYVSLGLIFVVYSLQGTPLNQVFAEFAVFGAAAMRLLPSVSKVVSHLQSLKHARPSVVAVISVLCKSNVTRKSGKCSFIKPIYFKTLSLRGVGFGYDDCPVISKLDLDIDVGDSLAIIGASGSGKSTLINLILGLLPPSYGLITLNSKPLAGCELSWWFCVAYVPQEPFLLDASAIANVMLGSTGHTPEDIERARDLIGRLDLPDAMKNSLDSIGEGGARLSGGQRQRLAIARALYRNPQVLILDEATSAMDMRTQTRVMNVVFDFMKGRTVLMITHRAETLSYFNKVLTMPEGRLTLGVRDHA
jgi:ABC-type multidrug transport system fused ATPase/permease subunit